MAKLHEANIFDAGRHPPEIFKRKVFAPGSTKPVWERFSPGRKVKMIDVNGNVRWAKVTTSASMRPELNYQQSRLQAWKRAGWLAYGDCPLRDPDSDLSEANFPEELRSPCRVKDEYGKRLYGPDRCCPHVEHVIAERQSEARERAKASEERQRAAEIRQERHLALIEEQNKILRDSITGRDDRVRRPRKTDE